LKRIKFWGHSFGCALLSKKLAQRLSYPDVELAYLAGLLHDIGETIISLHQYEAFEKVVQKVQAEKISFFAAEEEVLGINHTDFGECLINKWIYQRDFLKWWPANIPSNIRKMMTCWWLLSACQI
jgi:putative nucleotidyltransferase with HDIG domain